MKKTFVLVVIASLLFVARSTFAQCPSASERNVILTEGIAEITSQNDSAKVSVAIVTDGRNLEAVSSDNARITEDVLQAIKGLNVANLKLKTSNYRVVPQKDYKARPPEIKGYEVHNAIEVTLEGFEPEYLSKNTSRVVGKALESGANNIHHIQFYIKNKELLEQEALTQATQKAMDRARILAKAAGVRLKRVASIRTQPIHMPPKPHMLREAAVKTEAGTLAPPIEIGESKIRVQVTVAYEIE
jgi:uncharacterized protein YggE